MNAHPFPPASARPPQSAPAAKRSPQDSAIGQRVARVEDDRLVRGQSDYVTDRISRSKPMRMTILRSPYAHARLALIDVVAAREMRGVVDVIVAADLKGVSDLPCDWAPPGMVFEALHPVLASDIVRYVGQPVAAIIAETEEMALDALEAIRIDYEPLPAVAAIEAALEPDASRVHEGLQSNIALEKMRRAGDIERAFAQAEIFVQRRIINNRVAPSPMECRAALSSYDSATGILTHMATSQLPHVHARALATCLNLPINRLRLIAPDVGGGFGAKLGFYAEDVLAAFASLRVGRPVGWTEQRSESFLATTHGRDHVHHISIAARRDGTITALKAHVVADLGAYAFGMGPGVPAINTALSMTGPYHIPNVEVRVTGVHTNRTPTGPYRGAGHPEATFTLERMVDELGHELGIDPVQIRMRNFVPARKMPYRLPLGLSLDSGDYASNLKAALDLADYPRLRAMQNEARQAGRLVGIGIATYAEASGAAPSIGMGALGFRRAGHESARVVMHPDATVTVFSGAHAQGQGHATSLAQIAAGVFGISVDDVNVVQGDTSSVPFGTGTYNSRTMAVGGTAVHMAATKLLARLKRIAASRLRCRPRDLVLGGGTFRVKPGVGLMKTPAAFTARFVSRIKGPVFQRLTGLEPLAVSQAGSSLSLAEVASAAHLGHDLPLGMAPGLDETVFFDPKDMPVSSGTHIACLEIDRDTGQVTLLSHTIVDDCGRLINPMLAQGQIHGGASQGIGQALMEHMVHDDMGIPLSGSLMDYAMPRAADVPGFATGHTISPASGNPLGVKGVGEGAAIGAPPAIVNAVLDALRPLGVNDIDMPLTPQRVWQAISERKEVPALRGVMEKPMSDPHATRENRRANGVA